LVFKYLLLIDRLYNYNKPIKYHIIGPKKPAILYLTQYYILLEFLVEISDLKSHSQMPKSMQ